MTDNGGSVISRHDYLPFGEEIGAGVGSRTTGKLFSQYDNVRQKYAGMETDTATGMAHTLWRKQDNWSGRWTSPDPYGGSMTTANPQSFNRYVYSDNDPLNKVDPSGLVPNDYHGAQDGWGQVGGYMFDPTQCDPNGRKRSNSAARLGIMSNLHGNRVNRTIQDKNKQKAQEKKKETYTATAPKIMDPTLVINQEIEEGVYLTGIFGEIIFGIVGPDGKGIEIVSYTENPVSEDGTPLIQNPGVAKTNDGVIRDIVGNGQSSDEKLDGRKINGQLNKSLTEPNDSKTKQTIIATAKDGSQYKVTYGREFSNIGPDKQVVNYVGEKHTWKANATLVLTTPNTVERIR